jgi:adenylate cyclase
MSAARSGFVRWFGELRRRKVVRVAVAYLLLAWLVIQVADAVFEPLGLPVWALKLVIVLAALGFPVACGLAWAFDMTPTGVERTPPLALTEVAAATAASEPSRGAAEVPAQPSVAILPFLDLSPGRDQEYFCEGIAEEIINSLCFVRGLRVASRTSSFQFKDRRTDVREIGRNLGVTAVLEGSVRKSGDRVRITAQLINAADGYHHWSESFDRRLDDVFEIQSEIARQLVRALSLTLTPRRMPCWAAAARRTPQPTTFTCAASRRCARARTRRCHKLCSCSAKPSSATRSLHRRTRALRTRWPSRGCGVST